MKLPSPWSSPRGSLSVKSVLPKAGGAARRARRMTEANGERVERSMYISQIQDTEKVNDARRHDAKRHRRASEPLLLEADLHERLEALMGEVPLLEAVPATEAATETQRADRNTEVRRGLGVGGRRYEAAAEVGIELAVVVLVVEAELGAADGVAGVQDDLVLLVLARGHGVELVGLERGVAVLQVHVIHLEGQGAVEVVGELVTGADLDELIVHVPVVVAQAVERLPLIADGTVGSRDHRRVAVDLRRGIARRVETPVVGAGRAAARAVARQEGKEARFVHPLVGLVDPLQLAEHVD